MRTQSAGLYLCDLTRQLSLKPKGRTAPIQVSSPSHEIRQRAARVGRLERLHVLSDLTRQSLKTKGRTTRIQVLTPSSCCTPAPTLPVFITISFVSRIVSSVNTGSS